VLQGATLEFTRADFPELPQDGSTPMEVLSPLDIALQAVEQAAPPALTVAPIQVVASPVPVVTPVPTPEPPLVSVPVAPPQPPQVSVAQTVQIAPDEAPEITLDNKKPIV
jgi:hypothetical protein